MAPKFTIGTLFSAVDGVSGPAKTMMGNVKKSGEGMAKSMNAVKGALAGLATGLTIGAVVHAVTEFAEKGDEIARTSRALGMSAESLQKLRYAAKMADVPAEALTGALRKMNLNLGELRTRQGALFSHLSRTNPALARQLYTTKDSNKAFLMLVDAINHTSNAQERAALTVSAFGKSGQEMLPFIMQGSAKIGELGDESQRLGLIMGEDAVKAGAKFHESMKRLTAVGQGLLYQVLGKILEKLAPLIEAFAVWAIKDDNLVKLLPVLGLAILGAIVAVNALTVAFAAMDVAADANPIGLITVAIEAMAVAVLAVIIYWKQITDALRSAWNWFNKMFENPWIKVALYAVAAPLAVIASFIQTIVDLLSGKGWESFAHLAGPWKAFSDAIGLTHAGGFIGQKMTSPGGSGLAGENGTPVSPNARSMESQGYRWNGHVWVHAAPGTGVSDRPGGAPAPVVTLNMGWAAQTR